MALSGRTGAGGQGPLLGQEQTSCRSRLYPRIWCAGWPRTAWHSLRAMTWRPPQRGFLIGDGHAGAIYNATGPARVSGAERAAGCKPINRRRPGKPTRSMIVGGQYRSPPVCQTAHTADLPHSPDQFQKRGTPKEGSNCNWRQSQTLGGCGYPADDSAFLLRNAENMLNQSSPSRRTSNSRPSWQRRCPSSAAARRGKPTGQKDPSGRRKASGASRLAT